MGILSKKADWLRKETLKLHKLAPETRLASSLSCIEILTALYFGSILKFNPKEPLDEGRDRFIISKGHGSIAMYPLLAELGFFDKSELQKVCKEGSFLGSIPDPTVPGYETINGSLGQGLGVAAGMAIALRAKKLSSAVFVLSGDGEFYEGSVWEAVMFSSERRLDNLVLIIDQNKACMLDYCKNIIDLEPLENKLKIFGWEVACADGHNVDALSKQLLKFKHSRGGRPKALIADTVKGKGVPGLEGDPLSHIRTVPGEVIDAL